MVPMRTIGVSGSAAFPQYSYIVCMCAHSLVIVVCIYLYDLINIYTIYNASAVGTRE